MSGVEPSQFVAALDVQLVAKGISGIIRERKVWNVVQVLRSVENLGVSALKLFDVSAMKVLGSECRLIVKSGEVEEVVELMEILAGFRFVIKELVEPLDVIKICIDKRNPKLAVRYACLLPHAQILHCTIVHEFGKKGDLRSALIAFEMSKHELSGPNMYAYRTMIDVCGRCGDYIKSRDIYEELLSQKVTPNIYVFNSLMNVNSHDLSYTLSVYKHMQNLGVMADTASFNILLKACCLAERVDLAQDIYREVQHLESKGVMRLDVFTYSTIIKVLAGAKLWQMALRVKEDMLSAGVTPNTITWSSLISSCANAGLVEKAIQLFEEMLLAGCQPNSQCCNILLHAFVEARQYDRAFRLFQCWKGSSFQETSGEDDNCSADSILNEKRTYDNCITSMPNCISTSFNSTYAINIPFTPTTTTYNILLKACGTDYHRAKALIDEMQRAGLSPNHISWSILIDIYGGSGNVESAIQILKTMRMSGIKPDVIAYTTAIKVCVETKHLELAFSLFEEMKRYRIRPNLVTYNTILRARSRYGSLHEVQECLAIYQDMRKAGYKSSDYYLKELIEEWCEGVLQNNTQNQGQLSPCVKNDKGRPQSLLLEKVATLLQKTIAESLAIDLQGLTKVEARIVVLAVLRMIKEKYNLGHPIKDDMLIILGVAKLNASPPKQETEVKDALIKLLRDELGLEVLLAGPRIASLDIKTQPGSVLDSDQNMKEKLGKEGLSNEITFPTRRPAVFQRLKVTKKSLHHWLQRRLGAIRR